MRTCTHPPTASPRCSPAARARAATSPARSASPRPAASTTRSATSPRSPRTSSPSTRGRSPPRTSSAAARAAGREYELGIEVGARNAEAIGGAELLIAQLDGQEVDAGTAAEVGYAAALGLPCLAVRSDMRSSGEPGMHVNLQLEAFIVLSGGFVAASLADLVARLAALRGATQLG